MYHRLLAARGGCVRRAVAKQHGLLAEGGEAIAHHPPHMATLLAPGRTMIPAQGLRACTLSSQAAQKVDGAEEGGEGGDANGRKVRRTEEETRKVAAHKAALLEYKEKMTVLRKEVQQETKERRHAEAVSAALERRRIAKRKAAAATVKREKAAINVALNIETEARQKANYEAGFREAGRIFFEREERKKNIHAILLEELEEESKFWITTEDDVTSKITDDIWDIPGNDSTGRQIAMPDEQYWRFSADVGLCDQEEETSERNTYLRARMQSRMDEMQNADAYLRDRRRRWDNDTRGILKDADRLLRKRRPAPPGYMGRLEQARLDHERMLAEEDRKDSDYMRKEMEARAPDEGIKPAKAKAGAKSGRGRGGKAP